MRVPILLSAALLVCATPAQAQVDLKVTGYVTGTCVIDRSNGSDVLELGDLYGETGTVEEDVAVNLSCNELVQVAYRSENAKNRGADTALLHLVDNHQQTIRYTIKEGNDTVLMNVGEGRSNGNLRRSGDGSYQHLFRITVDKNPNYVPGVYEDTLRVEVRQQD